MSQRVDSIVDAAIEEEQRVKACAAEVGKILDHFGCVLSPQVIISLAGTRMKVDIIPRKAPAPPLNGNG
jgi:hypothetical protein